MIKRDISLYLVMILAIIFLASTSTYAYFTTSQEKAMENIVSASVEGIDINNTNIQVSDLYPASEEDATNAMNNQCKDSNSNNICFTYDFTITNNSDTTRHILYYLTPISNTFSNLKFKVLDSSNNLTMGKTSISKKNNKIGLTNMIKNITTNQTLTYKLLFWIDKQEEDQTILDASRSFNGQLSIELLTTGEYNTTSPIISTVSLIEDQRTRGDGNVGNFTVSWSSEDTDVSKYIVNIYNSNNELQFTDEVDGNTTSKTYNGIDNNMSRGQYYAQVYGVDNLNNSGELYCAEDNSTYCSKSNIATLNYQLLYKTNYLASNSSTAGYVMTIYTPDEDIYYGGDVTFSVVRHTTQTNDQYTVKSWELYYVKPDGTHESSPFDYGTGDTTNHTTKGLTNDFEIVAEANTCLAEGTKILLASGKYKNIEDIDYNDLLTVYDHESGTISYQYPSWIEAPGVDNKYILITFDDNTELKVVKDHGIYSLDYNEYVRVNDRDKFKIGSRVVKINNGKLEEVKVKNIEVIEEEVKFYFMFTNRHFNLITNDILTGSPDVFIYNFHGFNEDLTWKRPLLENDIYSYDELSEVPYYLYKGMRLYEGKYFNNYGMNKEDYLNFLRNTIINEVRTVKPKLNENGNRQWMVTTSEDIVNEENKLSYLMEEGDYYTLKTPKTIKGKKFIGWLHTGENIMYQPGDKVEVLYGTHFIAKYQDLFEINNNFGVKR